MNRLSSEFQVLLSINQREKDNDNYHLTDDELKVLLKHLRRETIRFPTTFRNGLMKSFNLIEDGEIVTHNTLTSCYAGFTPKNIDEIITRLKTFNLTRVGAHGMNGDLIPVNPISYNILASITKTMSECLITLCVSIWNVNILELFDYLHPSRKVEGINFAILVTDDFKEAINKREQFKLYYATYDQVINQERDDTHYAFSIDAVELYNKLCHCIQVSSVSVINIDKMNRHNMNKHLGKVTCTNICTEILPVGDFACTLGSLNLHHFITPSTINRTQRRYGIQPKMIFDWDLFDEAVQSIVKTLNLAVNITYNTTDEKIHLFNKNVLRPIGIGVSGYADCLIEMGIEYEESSQFAYKLFSRLLCVAVETSMEIASYHPEMIPTKWSGSEWAKGRLPIDLCDDLSVTYEKEEEIERRLNTVRSLLKIRPMVNSNLIAHMPTLRRGIEKNMCLSLTPLHSLMTEVGTEEKRVLYYARGIPEHLKTLVFKQRGRWSPQFSSVLKTSDLMDQKKILNIYYIAQLFCDMAISITPHFRVNNIQTIHDFLSKSYNLNTPLYYMRLDIDSDVIQNEDKCKNGLCTI